MLLPSYVRHWPIMLAGALFLVGVCAGLFSNVPRPELDALAPYSSLLNPPAPIGLIAINGVSVLQLSLAFLSGGALAIGWTSMLGFDLGSAIGALLRTGASADQLLASLAPHGIIEVPAFVLAGASGLGGAGALAAEANGHRAEALRYLRQSFVRLLIALGMIVLAALLEAWITPVALRALL